MSTIGNELARRAFVTGPEIRIGPLLSSPIEVNWQTSPQIEFEVGKAQKTPNPRKADSLTVVAVPRDSKMGGWRLKSLIVVQIRRVGRESVATTWLEGIPEYGAGKADGDAIVDLVVSLGEYLESLQKQQGNLGDSVRKEMDYLGRVIERGEVGVSGTD